MKINSSAVAMTSEHRAFSYAETTRLTMEAPTSDNAAAAILTLSSKSQSGNVQDAMVEYQENQKKEQEQQDKQRQANALKSLTEAVRASKPEENQFAVPEEEDYEITLIKKILAALNGKEYKGDGKVRVKNPGQDVLGLKAAWQSQHQETQSIDLVGISRPIGTEENAGEAVTESSGGASIPASSTWQRITASHSLVAESEQTAFATTGYAQTADGRTLSFNVEVGMSRSFMAHYDSVTAEDYVKPQVHTFTTDPLIINVGDNVTSVSDQKFYFDLDGDGKKDQISYASQGSGFLALDKNGDGVINDGSELFGTKSGDGFKDLAEYDEDGNGWIDEGDSVFSKLKVWKHNEDGTDTLLELKQADVGAIYLGNANTEFSLKDENNNLNGQIRKTGIYLKESTGAAGTIAHVDLAL